MSLSINRKPINQRAFEVEMTVCIVRPLTVLRSFALFVTASMCSGAVPAIKTPAPATPLIACDPYFSVWSPSDKLTDSDTEHWTGKPHRLAILTTIDGDAFRLMGETPRHVPALEQIRKEITPTQTRYGFAGSGVEVELCFTTPALPSDIDVLSRPITYLTFQVKSSDGRTHDVGLLAMASAELTVNSPEQGVVGFIERPGELIALKTGSQEQAVLEAKGDDIRIDWGYLYLAAPADQTAGAAIAAPAKLEADFAAGEAFPGETTEPVAARADQLASAMAFRLDKVGAEPVSRWMVFAYDDIASIEYMGRHLQPYWRRNGLDAAGLLVEAARDREKLLSACDAFDRELTGDLVEAGGEEYAAIAVLAYRQCFAAGKFVADANGQPIQFCKENHSNGCIGTSDVFYPMAPQFLLFGSSLAKSFVVPFMEYAASDRWTFPFAPHDLGTYPKANGQVYGGGERNEDNQMPVEESGNLLILMAAIAQVDGDASFAERYWPQLSSWAEYLRQEGFDPANQLCTDDFAGHMAHNVNLSAKAICGLGAYAKLCELRGDTRQANKFRQVAEDFAARWVKEADDGDHFRLAFDVEGSWSQKYNLVWDRVLGLSLFPTSVFEKEMAFYKQNQNRYGLPLDNRKTYTKLDWILWTATLTQNRDDFIALTHPVYEFLQDTPDRSPMTDWYETKSAKKVGFTARPVVGGVFMQLLHNPAVWKKWASRDQTNASGYAPMPRPPKVTMQVAAADGRPKTWRYTTDKPKDDWFSPRFDDSGWREGKSGFGTVQTPGARVGTVWDSGQIWLRRTFDLPKLASETARLHIHHDEDAEIYINGVLARSVTGFTSDYEQLQMRSEALKSIKSSGNVLAVHCCQSTGGQYIDVGIATVEPSED